MRKCVRCGSEMREKCGIRVSTTNERLIALTKEDTIVDGWIEKPKIAICPECGEISFYIEDLDRLKWLIELDS